MVRRRPHFDVMELRLCLTVPTLQTAFELPQSGSWTPTVYRSSPLMVDIFGTGKDDLIAVTAGAQLIAYSENADGSASPVVTYQVPGGLADIKSTPIIVTDPRTGQKDLFAGMGRDETTNNPALEDGRVFGWNLQTGQLLPGWTSGQSTGHNVDGLSGVYGSLTSGQLESNGLPDIIVTSFSHNVTAFRLDGSTIWQWTNDDTIISGAVVGDIDRDGQQEVVVGGDSSNNGFYQAGGWVNVLSNTGILKWRKFIPGEVTWSSPTLADLNNNGYLDIVIGTGLNYDASGVAGARAAGNNIYAFDPFGNLLPGWPYHTTTNDSQAHEVLASIAVADLSGTGQLDVVAVDRSGFVHVIQPNGQDLPAFAGGKSINPSFPPGTLPDDYGSPIIADVTGSGSPEIVASYGPFLVVFDRFGNMATIATTANGPGGSTNEGIDSAAVVGHFDGGTAWTLAYVSYNPFLQNRPDEVQIFKVSATNVVPPWPSLRRTVSGDAVVRSSTFDRLYIASSFYAALGFLPDQGTLNGFQSSLDSDSLSLLGTSLIINSSPIVRQTEVERLYQRFLGHNPDSYSLTSFTNYLATNTYRDLELILASSPEFAQRAGNSPSQEVVQLFQAILGRNPSQAELSYWVSLNQSPGVLAGMFINGDGVGTELNVVFASAFGQGSQNFIPADALAAYSYDIHHGAREEVINAEVLASNGNYAATNLEAGYVRDLYRDILGRNANASETATWVQAVDQGTVALSALPGIFLNSGEARDNFVQQEFQTLLGRSADAATVASMAGYANRESVIITIVGSPEYFSKNGGTYTSFVQAAFRDLAGIQVDSTDLNAYVTKLSSGLTPTNVAQQIIYLGTLYFQNTIVQELTVYLPDEFEGVLRSGNLSPTAAGQPINPNPTLINYLLSLQLSGQTDEQVISTILTSPQYFSRIAYYKGIYRSPGIRN